MSNNIINLKEIVNVEEITKALNKINNNSIELGTETFAMIHRIKQKYRIVIINTIYNKQVKIRLDYFNFDDVEGRKEYIEFIISVINEEFTYYKSRNLLLVDDIFYEPIEIIDKSSGNPICIGIDKSIKNTRDVEEIKRKNRMQKLVNEIHNVDIKYNKLLEELFDITSTSNK